LISLRRRGLLFGPLFLVSLWLVAWAAARVLIVNSPLPNADAIAVLSGAASYKERTAYAAQLFRAGRAPRIVLTNDNYKGGWSHVEERNPFYYELETSELVRLGVPRDRIDVILEPVDGTYKEAIVLRGHAESNGLKSMLVVTSAYHSRRALWTLRKVFEGSNLSIGLQSVRPGRQTPTPGTWWVYLRGWKEVPPEYVKMAYYWLTIR
jgi:uncharacterized SAM-binding protein YcdF (DUF218 family)